MTSYLQFAALGLGSGAAYAVFALGIVALYRGSGVLNFAHCAIGLVAAYLYADLTQRSGWATVPAMVVAVGAAALIGVATYFLLIRPLRGASALSRVIATLGVLLVIQGAAVLIWDSQPRFVDPILGQGIVNVGSVHIGADRLILLGIAGAITVLLTVGYRYTTVGLATSAVSESPRAAAALGWSPDVLAGATWAMASALAGLAGILIAPLTGIQASAMPLLVIPALAATLFGGLTSFPLTLLGAVVIGVIQSLVAFKVDVQGAADTLPFLLIVVALVVRGKGLPVRGYIGERFADVGSGRVRPAVLVPGVVVLAALMLTVFGDDLLAASTTTLGVGCILLSIVVLTGQAGQLSLAQFAVAGAGALIAAKLDKNVGLPFPLAVLGGALATVPVGVLFGLPALRTRGVNLAIVTLGLGLAVQSMVFNNPSVAGTADGTPVDAPSVLGLSLDAIDHPGRYAVLTLVLFTLCGLLVANVRRGVIGRRLIAVRTNERAAAALGIGVFDAKLYAFGLAAFIAAVGGVLIGFQDHTVAYAPFNPIGSIGGVAFAVVGSVGWVLGAVVGATFYAGALGSWVIQVVFGGSIDRYITLVGGVSLLVFLLLNPNGIVSGDAKLLRALRARRGAGDAGAAAAAIAAATEPAGEAPARRDGRSLDVRGLTVRYGGVTAVSDFSVTVAPGEIVGLIGPNGAGKTSVIDAVSGFAPAAGEVRLGDMALDGLSVHRRARAGVSRSFQSLELFDDVSVLENLRAASDPQGWRSYVAELFRPGRASLPATAQAAVREFRLEDDLGQRPDALSYGRRRLVAVARAVAADPEILLLDEPAAGLDERESAELAELVRVLAKRWGIGVLVVEHDMAFVMSLCDRVTVLDFGRQIASGSVAEIREDPAVIAAYLGAPSEEVGGLA
ncbi:MAG TPA: ATP-binding cassette domain-containing protein [Baekduia sp.]|uniref:ABC transporter permease subunit n=1 Tax=Baekduia sp. TaxID=2600305 RepID=UPI002D76C3D6|nr:ATP-binding cassette domain-containing protein [Baekduia sp.]HET6509981.1 ATP-binding cassette domain-containing protein [Baekduia sp.]